MSLITNDLLKVVSLPLPEAECKEVKLDFKNIIRIDNLWKFCNLRKLQLENNRIEKIEGLEKLVHLTWLDLSYNRIRVIDGLEKLRELRTLSLTSNLINTFQNMDELKQLQLLSIGHNRIESFDQLIYLRKFECLKCLVFEGNPITPILQSIEYKEQVIVRLPTLKYLDYEIVDQDMVREATVKHGWMVKDVEERESKEKLEYNIFKDAREKLDLYRVCSDVIRQFDEWRKCVEAFIEELCENAFITKAIFEPLKALFIKEPVIITELNLVNQFESKVETINENARVNIILKREEYQRDGKWNFISKWSAHEIEARRGDEIKNLTMELLSNLSENLLIFHQDYTNLINDSTDKVDLLEKGGDYPLNPEAIKVLSTARQNLSDLPQKAQLQSDKWYHELSHHHNILELYENRKNIALFLHNDKTLSKQMRK